MADDDEIDILGDFSFNSCLAQNNQGIPSCSDREDTVHPQWLLDSTATNWYDKNKVKQGPTRKLSGTSQKRRGNQRQTVWSKAERNLLASEMIKHGRNVKKISLTLKSKTEAEIHALIEAEFGISLDNSPIKEKPITSLKVISHGVSNLQKTMDMVQTAAPTVVLPLKPFQRKPSKNSLLKPDLFTNAEKKELVAIKPSEILYEDDLIVGSTESVRTDKDSTEIANSFVELKEAAKNNRKYGNHRRKVSRNFDKMKGRNRSNEKNLKSPQGRRRKNSSVSDESTKSPKLQIVLGSGQKLPISEGEQVIKIEKKKDSDSDCEVDVDVDSDIEEQTQQSQSVVKLPSKVEEPTATNVTSIKFAPMPKRHKKFNLDGEGGYTIMHTAAGDLVAAGAEPRRERARAPPAPPAPPVPLLPCRFYGAHRPPPCRVFMHVSTLILMDSHAHTSRAEVMGLAGGGGGGAPAAGGGGWGEAGAEPPAVTVSGYQPARAAADGTHCDMDPVSQALAARALEARGLRALGWHHSHPGFPAAPSATDLRSQAALQAALDRAAPFLAFISSQHWPAPGAAHLASRNASVVRCIRVEHDEGPESLTGYQLSMRLVPDLNAENLDTFLNELRTVLISGDKDELSVDMKRDVCPQAQITYLDKCISSISHHLRSAGYEDNDVLVKQLLQGVRDVFR